MNMRKNILHGPLRKIHYEHHHSPPASQVDYELHQLISQKTLGGWNSQQSVETSIPKS